MVNSQIEKVARKTLQLARNTLLVNLRFLDMSISQLKLQSLPVISSLATDGDTLYYNPGYVLSRFLRENSTPTRDFLHVIFHCIFHHAFVDGLVDQACWDLACDMAVENAINDLGIEQVRSRRQLNQAVVHNDLKTDLRLLTAEKLYRFFCDKHLEDLELAHLRSGFYADDHTLWYQPLIESSNLKTGKNQDQENAANITQGLKSTDAQGKSADRVSGKSTGEKGQAAGGKTTLGEARANRQALKQTWQKISERAQVDLETMSAQWGNQKGGLFQSLNEVTREKYDYAEFLKRFAVMGETIQVNEDEFDLVFYTYGLRIYENMPLIEPLEYKEVKRIKDFVIAIDTSGSVQGEIVQAFVQKTYNILMQTENFFRKVNLHIIQCDAEIQKDIKIRNRAEFQKYIKTMTLRGFGGTDFRPVFNYVNQLVEEREFDNLRGILYFTDGYGTYPSAEPAYETAFVFLKDDYFDLPEVPYWAIKLILSTDEIMEL